MKNSVFVTYSITRENKLRCLQTS